MLNRKSIESYLADKIEVSVPEVLAAIDGHYDDWRPREMGQITETLKSLGWTLQPDEVTWLCPSK